LNNYFCCSSCFDEFTLLFSQQATGPQGRNMNPEPDGVPASGNTVLGEVGVKGAVIDADDGYCHEYDKEQNDG
jgi:hypothetical protein